MQTLGLSESTPRTENRLQSLFWPSVQSATDVDYLGTQGYWVCTGLAILSLIALGATGHAVSGFLVLLFFYLGGVGVREHSRYAAAVVFALYALDALTSPLSVVRVLIGAILLSNVRATWIASDWKPESEEAVPPPRLGDTWGDKFADKLPAWLWPKVRIFYYILSGALLVLAVLGMGVILSRHAR